jgi:electron transport complex protein RnfG
MIITAIAAGALSAVNRVTAPRIAEAKRRAEQEALKKALPEAQDGVFVPVENEENLSLYKGYANADTTQSLLGYVFKALGKGYSSTIESMVGINREGVIEGVVILYQMETPGLGAKVVEKGRYGNRECYWYDQFKELTAERLILDKDDPSNKTIDSVTGATISSRAITKSILEGITLLQEVVERENP